MYQVSNRELGQCILCPEEQEVATLTKGGQTVSLCKRHLWEALKGSGQDKPKKAKSRKKVSGETVHTSEGVFESGQERRSYTQPDEGSKS